MKIYVNSITGIEDAIVSTLMSKRSWTREKENDVRAICERVIDRNGRFYKDEPIELEDICKYDRWIDSVLRIGWKHITILRYIDISVSVNGLHRGGQDDWDSHAKRFDNRIVRSSTRLSDFDNYEMSEWYQDKIIPTDVALEFLGIEAPKEITKDGIVYVKTVNGYIRKDMKDDKDVKRGLYMLSIPSDFTFKINLTEWSHVYKMRNEISTANPEVKICCEEIARQITEIQPKFNRELFEKIEN